jgi:BMFP domain-containing protein YqiC
VIDPKIFNDMANKLAGAIPSGARDIQHDLEKNFKAVLQSKFAKLDLVTREEFDVQKAVLQRTREKLEALEKQVAELELENRK